MLVAITRRVSASIARCELGYLPRRSIDARKASEQHALYEACLSELGLSVIPLLAEPEMPDAVFVEDTAVVVQELAPFGYTVEAVEIRDCLHMKSACCYLGRETILANRAWVDTAAFREFRIVDVAPNEPWAANVLVIGETVIIPSSFPATARMLAELGWKVRPLDVSELMKAEAGVTCMSLIFETFPSR